MVGIFLYPQKTRRCQILSSKYKWHFCFIPGITFRNLLYETIYIYIYVLAMIDVKEYSFTLSQVVSLYTNWGHSLSVKYSLSEEIFLFTYVFYVIICHRDQNLVQNIQCFIAKQWSVFILNLYKTFFVCFVHVSLYMYFCQLYCFVFEHVSVIVNV